LTFGQLSDFRRLTWVGLVVKGCRVVVSAWLIFLGFNWEIVWPSLAHYLRFGTILLFMAFSPVKSHKNALRCFKSCFMNYEHFSYI